MVEINPIELIGNWFWGYSLDIHTIRNEYIDDDEFGNPKFDTERSDMGELLYRLKYKSDKSVINEIITTVHYFIDSYNIDIDIIIPVPPSRKVRKFQPVIEIARKVVNSMKISSCPDCIVKVKDTPKLKDIDDYGERTKLLSDAFSINNQAVDGKSVLLFDDLYRSGATLNTISKALYEKGKAVKVNVLTLTKTRSNK